jgi:hypothetical protein
MDGDTALRRMRCTGAINRATSDYEPLRRDDADSNPCLARARQATLSHPGLGAGGVGRAASSTRRTKDKALFASSGTFEISDNGFGRRCKRPAK